MKNPKPFAMKTAQYFYYEKSGQAGVKKFLLMKNEYDDIVERLIGELGKSVTEAFERTTGKHDCCNIHLVLEIHE